MNKFFPEIKKNFGFGCMRFPTRDEAVDVAAVTEMVDYFMESGFNYFYTIFLITTFFLLSLKAYSNGW